MSSYRSIHVSPLAAGAVLLGLVATTAGTLLALPIVALPGLAVTAAGLLGHGVPTWRARQRWRHAQARHDDVWELCEAAGLGVAWLTPKSEVTLANHPFARRVGLLPAQLVGMSLSNMRTPPSAERRQVDDLARRLHSGEIDSYCLTHPFRTIASGPEVWARLTSKAIRNQPGGAVDRILILSQDVTTEVVSAQALEERNHMLRASEERLQAIFEHAPVGIGYYDLDGTCLLVNRRLCEMRERPAEELVGRRWRDLISPEPPSEYLAAAMEMHRELVAGKRQRFSIEMPTTLRDGTQVWRRNTGAIIPNPESGQPCLISILEDIDELKKAEAAASHVALYDTLTGLPNRRLLIDRTEHVLRLSHRSGQYGALIFIDIDNFKHLNDARGHHVGDRLLQELAARLGDTLREQDTVARFGGDEFVVLIDGLGREYTAAADTVERIAGKLRQLLAQPILLGHSHYYPSASLGVTLFPQPEAASASALLKQADAAMYSAKRTRNAVAFYSHELQAAAEQRLLLERDLHRALANGEFRLLLQPKFDRDNTPVGAEALLRWDHPTRGSIAPADFIPVAEASGLIVPIGQWALTQACDILRRTPPELGQTLAVNVSPRQFRDACFVEWLGDLLRDTDTDASRLTLEITEGLVLEFGTEINQRLNKLHSLGVRISIDDFGTGYSSLAYLKRLPLHELKIDRAFVADLPHDQNGAAIVEAILSMAHHLGLEVVAEGVETEAQLQFLKGHGCNGFQGFLLAHPEPTAAYLSRLARA